MVLSRNELEEKIANYIGRKYCLLVGRATTAIYLAIKAFNFNKGNIIIPSIVCPNPVFPILYNNLQPKFCDINLNDYTIDIKSFNDNIDENTKAVIPINLYGYPANYDELISICKRNEIKIIEDAAQSLGGSYHRKKMGSFGDVSVISFGHTKIIDVNSGGAILTDDINLFNTIKLEYKNLAEIPKDYNIKAELYRKIYYSLQPFWQIYDDLYYLYSTFPIIFKSIYLFKFQEDLIQPLWEGFKNIDQEVTFRKKNAKIYYNFLKNQSRIILPKYKEEDIGYWRFCFLIKGDNQLYITEELRKKKIDVSNWYPSLHKMFIPFNDYNPIDFKNSEYLEKHIFNFWIHSDISEDNIKNTCNTLLTLLR